MEKDLVSIIIVNYNTENLLEDCILSIKELTKDVNYEIIVVDNASMKGSLENLKSKFADVKFHLMDENLGFGAANNIGATLAKGEFLFFLNPDTILLNDAVSILHEYLRDHGEVGVCGGNMYKGDMSPAVSFHVLDFYIREFRILFNKKWKLGFNNSPHPKEVNVIMGADLFIMKSLFLEFGGFDKDFFMYFEEVELCDRLKKADYKIMSVPEAKIIHLEGGSAENKNEELNKWSYKEHWYSKFVFFSKTKGKLQTQVLYYAYILKMKMAMLYFSIRSNHEKLKYWDLKKNIINDTFSRYQKYLINKE